MNIFTLLWNFLQATGVMYKIHGLLYLFEKYLDSAQ